MNQIIKTSSKFIAQRPRLIIILAMLFWGASFPAMKYTISIFHPYFVVWMRMIIGTVCLIPFLSKNEWASYKKGDWVILTAMVLFEPFLYFIFETKALTLTTATQAGFIASTLPLLVIVSSAIILKEVIYMRSILGILIAFSGAILLTIGSESNDWAPNPILGNTYEFLAMTAATAFTLTLKKLTTRYSPLFLTFIQTSGGAILFSPIIILEFKQLFILTLHPQAFALLIFLGTVVTVLAYVCYISGIQKIPATEAILFVNLIPVFGLALSFFLLKETLSSIQVIACILLLGGVIVGQIKSKRLPNPGAESA